MRELGVDISAQRSRALTTNLLQQADYIFGMTHGHVDTIALLYPAAAEKTFLLREFDESLDPFEKDISDPIGSPYDVYVNCRKQIEQGIASILKFMEQHEILSAPHGAKTSSPVNFALGADHGGFELKESLKQHLQQRGLTVTDFGAKSKDPADDYPDFANPVAQAVAAGQAELGLLVCTSGVGICIAANKIPGVRAALVGDANLAALVRQHNDVNVLCLERQRHRARPRWKNPRRLYRRKIRGRPPRTPCRKNGRPSRIAGAAPAKRGFRCRRGHRTRAIAPAGKHRADCQRKFRQPGGAGSARLGADEQIRRGLSEKTLVWRLRKH